MALRTQFLEQYRKCIDDEGNVRVCGREACKTLIQLAQELTGNKTLYYGDVTIGFLNPKHLQELYQRIQAEQPPQL